MKEIDDALHIINCDELDALRRKIKCFYDEGMMTLHLDGLKGVTKVEVRSNYDEQQVEVVLYEDDAVVGDWTFKEKGNNVVCIDDNTIADMTSASTFFKEEEQ